MFTGWVIPTRTTLRTGTGPEAPTPVEPSTVATAAADWFVIRYQDLFGQEVFRFFPQVGAALAVAAGEHRDDTGRCSAAGDDTVIGEVAGDGVSAAFAGIALPFPGARHEEDDGGDDPDHHGDVDDDHDDGQ